MDLYKSFEKCAGRIAADVFFICCEELDDVHNETVQCFDCL